jgi:hypothetical protein
MMKTTMPPSTAIKASWFLSIALKMFSEDIKVTVRA